MSSALIVNNLTTMPHLDHPPPPASPSASSNNLPANPAAAASPNTSPTANDIPNQASPAGAAASASSTATATTPLLCFGDIPITPSFLRYSPCYNNNSPSNASSSPRTPPSPTTACTPPHPPRDPICTSPPPTSPSPSTSSCNFYTSPSLTSPASSTSAAPRLSPQPAPSLPVSDPCGPAQSHDLNALPDFGPACTFPAPCSNTICSSPLSRRSSDTISSSPLSRRSSDSTGDSPPDRGMPPPTCCEGVASPSHPSFASNTDSGTTSNSPYGMVCRSNSANLESASSPSGGSIGLSHLPTDTFMALQELKASMVELAQAAADDHLSDQEEIWPADSWPALDVYSSDDFRMFEFKVRKCVRGRSHDWTECPFSHPGEKARRRDPRRYHYSGTACPDFRKGNCRRGDACEFAHGVFECWLHPARYRTQPCKDGRNCRRRVCFFAHTPEQLRVVPAEALELAQSPVTPGGSSSAATRTSLLKAAAALSGGAYDGSPLRRALAGTLDGKVALELFLDHDNKSCSSIRDPASTLRAVHSSSWAAANISSPNSTLQVPVANMGSPDSPANSVTTSSPDSPPLICNSPVSHSWPTMVPTHRRHLDRLRSTPTLSVPSFEDTCELVSNLRALGHLSSPGVNTSVQSCRESRPSSLWSRGLSHLQNASLPLSAPSSPFARYGYSSSNKANSSSLMSLGLEDVEMKSDVGFKSASFSHGRGGASLMDHLGPVTVKSAAAFSHGHTSGMQSVNDTNVAGAATTESETPDLDWVNDLVR